MPDFTKHVDSLDKIPDMVGAMRNDVWILAKSNRVHSWRTYGRTNRRSGLMQAIVDMIARASNGCFDASVVP